jgi:predicted DNA-binding antitoxin AbrB/MazE fold protein
MTQALDAIFEDGVFKPLTAPQISEHQKVHLLVEVSGTSLAPDSGAQNAGQQLLKTLHEVSRPLGGKPWKNRGELYER